MSIFVERDKSRIKAAEAQGWTGPWRLGNTHLHGTPPGKTPKTRNHDGEHVPDVIDKIIVDLYKRIETLNFRVEYLNEGIKTVRSLIDESSGVVGLHKNGEVALWSDLQEGGRFEEWLSRFNLAEWYTE